MSFTKFPKAFFTLLFFLSIFLSIQTHASKVMSAALSTPEKIKKAVEYSGVSAEKKMKDLLKADLHYAQALYYLNREKAGFMAQERFELAHDRAIADIRALSLIKEDSARMQKALEARQSWLGGFKRAQFKDIPKERGFF